MGGTKHSLHKCITQQEKDRTTPNTSYYDKVRQRLIEDSHLGPDYNNDQSLVSHLGSCDNSHN